MGIGISLGFFSAFEPRRSPFGVTGGIGGGGCWWRDLGSLGGWGGLFFTYEELLAPVFACDLALAFGERALFLEIDGRGEGEFRDCPAHASEEGIGEDDDEEGEEEWQADVGKARGGRGAPGIFEIE